MVDSQGISRMARAVIEIEAREIGALTERVDEDFVEACRLMLSCTGRIVVTGMGKSGHIANKIAATLASTGTPAFFVHPGEASHGDLGMITAQDVMLMISYSGETDELLTIVPVIRRLGIPLIAMTGKPQSRLAKVATVHINASISEEACPLGLAPTSSTTAALVLGDALAISLLESRGFTREDFARSHPAGQLGRRLLLHIADVMHTGDEVPRVRVDTPMGTAVVEMSAKGLGMAVVVDADGKLLGMVTDGDLRRALDHGIDLREATVGDLMTRQPRSIQAEKLAVEGAEMMEHRKINGLPVVDENHRVVGALNIHDLLRAGVV